MFNDIEFSDEQKKVLVDFEEGHNIYLCGEAGTGKSTLISEMVDINLEREKPLNLAVVAPTGRAALNVGGSTIHSFFKFPTTALNYEIVYNCLKDDVIEKLNTLNVLIIEEVSMVRIDLFVAMDIALKESRNKKDEPFGGVQVIAIGDFNQLPPVVTSREKKIFSKNKFCFSSNQWHESELITHHLTKSFRQTSDVEYSSQLKKLKKNDKEAISYFNENCSRDYEDTAIIITTTNKSADSINKNNLDKIDKPVSTFKAKYHGKLKKSDNPVPSKLEFKEGCRVVCCLNLTSGVCNGSLGTVKKIHDEERIIVSFDCGAELTIRPQTWQIRDYEVKGSKFSSNIVGEYTQIPLKLGYAMTIHKAQGMTIDSLHVDLGRGCFEHGQLYVALSRCRNIDQLSLARSIYRSDLIVDPKVQEFLIEQNLV